MSRRHARPFTRLLADDFAAATRPRSRHARLPSRRRRRRVCRARRAVDYRAEPCDAASDDVSRTFSACHG